ncbi:carboxypeptidase Taq Metallo peptidase. MEROPS family M32 [Cnuella takakiae]|uniref:Metal-dependent carboxypeptidase n=1 Tax=Cnuella takakiae TaxID=1302690 RepID=A0A1M5FN42_9BACT|nr:carboxypeptidase M32 [Cnuella takakiae]OLY93714.1 carboxypeptidase [Cnuella takakiae]SHF92592.1 carboxypeptidase Taq Metallo peptidase. MEROPS family M32 [Cnuella takakiae]
MSNTRELYQQYQEEMAQLADVRFTGAVLQWDQETYLPAKGAEFRGRQLSTLSEIAHRMATSEKLGALLHELQGSDGLTPAEQKNVQLTWEDFSKQQKYPAAFVRQLSDAINKAFHAWMEARKANNFGVFEKDLDALLQLKKQEASLLGYTGHPYNALLNEYEKGATVEGIDRSFAAILPQLKNLLDRITSRPQVADAFLQKTYPKDKQWEWGMWLVQQLNYDLAAGRQDISEHPFSTSFNPQDVRITTRVDEQDFANMTWSTIHEVGHALYEQGLPTEGYGLPSGEACSYSIHESQSRLWENNVGRSRGFWQHFLPELKRYFPDQLGDIDLDTFYRGINKVQPSLIRTEADEITYHFHVAIRYELEKQLLDGSLATADIPAYWNEHYQKYLGITVPDDKRGCLQDVHWSHGSFGYFPTYSLGSFYAAQFYHAATEANAGLVSEIKNGNTANLLSWLREKVHASGRLHTSEELCTQVSSKALDASVFLHYLETKYQFIYGL